MIAVDLHTPASPEAVLIALRAHAGVWRQSEVPPDLWRDGLAMIECRVQGATCTLTTVRRGRAWPVRGRVVVEPVKDGSVVHVRVGYSTQGVAFPAIGFTLISFIGVFVYGLKALLFLAFGWGFVAVAVLLARLETWWLAPGRNAEADYVVQRIREAVDGATQPPVGNVV